MAKGCGEGRRERQTGGWREGLFGGANDILELGGEDGGTTL